MKVIVCGGRDFNDREAVFSVMDLLLETHGMFDLIHGACPTGADALADEWARERGVKVVKFPADWSQGRKAGPVRNYQMAVSGAEMCVAFPGGRGTADMVRRAKDFDMTIVEVDPATREVVVK